jgi:hypothetical protein
VTADPGEAFDDANAEMIATVRLAAAYVEYRDAIRWNGPPDKARTTGEMAERIQAFSQAQERRHAALRALDKAEAAYRRAKETATP